MAKTVQVFDFVLEGAGSTEADEGDLSISLPEVRLTLSRWSETSDGRIAITPGCVSEAEIDSQVALLKADLDAAASRAKRKLCRALQHAL